MAIWPLVLKCEKCGAEPYVSCVQQPDDNPEEFNPGASKYNIHRERIDAVIALAGL
jgi:hypothetical protein